MPKLIGLSIIMRRYREKYGRSFVSDLLDDKDRAHRLAELMLPPIQKNVMLGRALCRLAPRLGVDTVDKWNEFACYAVKRMCHLPSPVLKALEIIHYPPNKKIVFKANGETLSKPKLFRSGRYDRLEFWERLAKRRQRNEYARWWREQCRLYICEICSRKAEHGHKGIFTIYMPHAPIRALQEDGILERYSGGNGVSACFACRMKIAKQQNRIDDVASLITFINRAKKELTHGNKTNHNVKRARNAGDGNEARGERRVVSR